MKQIELGDFVVFRNPLPDEVWNGEPLKYKVTEVNGDRCYIEAVTPSLHIRPLYVAFVSELITVEDYKKG